MFQWPFGAQRRARQRVVEALYGEIVAAARRPRLYSELQVPDTPLGRFEMLSLHLFLLLHRLRGETGVLADLAQELTDYFFREVDHSLRELGIGDLGVPKRIKKLARMFYGRLSAYGQAVDAGNEAELAGALRRNIMPDRAVWDESAVLAAYMLEACHVLSGLANEELLAGKLTFPPLPQEKS
ncbi:MULTISPECIES: ubiquinol-cytochrome C chaperone family protein [Chelativorans]|jgi:cytochrome b pre-mRNA-processing protein 3|uniref:Ubiquinol-cytochrome C chaperone n=1 Tax=Chelativorans sp. (strain BNC1) TaxID=266779 RepID=Q11J86_CHESB|nr:MULTISPECIES: ubiquinol-cytochrome C chaperone family protein [Chelativorans]